AQHVLKVRASWPVARELGILITRQDKRVAVLVAQPETGRDFVFTDVEPADVNDIPQSWIGRDVMEEGEIAGPVEDVLDLHAVVGVPLLLNQQVHRPLDLVGSCDLDETDLAMLGEMLELPPLPFARRGRALGREEFVPVESKGREVSAICPRRDREVE